MRKNLWIKIGAVAMSAVLLASTFIQVLPTKASDTTEDTSKGTYIDFEDGTASELVMIDGDPKEVLFDSRIQSINNTKALFLNQDNGTFDTVYYEPDKEVFDEGTSCVRPSNVEFRFKAYKADGNDDSMFDFYPLVNEAYRNNNHMYHWPYINAFYYNWTSHTPRYSESIKLSSHNTGHDKVTLSAGEQETYFAPVTATSISETDWFTCQCAYDWNDFATSKTVKCTITISKGTITSEPYELTLTVTDEGFATQALYGFAFRGENLQDFCIDDIAVTLESIDSEGNSSTHAPNVPVEPEVPVESNSAKGDYIDFTDGKASQLVMINGMVEEISFESLIQSVSNTKALFLNKGDGIIYYQPDKEKFDSGVACVRPSNVQFRFKAYIPDGNDTSAFMFYPLVNEKYRNNDHMFYWPNVQAYYWNWTSYARQSEAIRLYKGDTKQTKVSIEAGDQETCYAPVTATSIDGTDWFTYNCAYDWSQFASDAIVKCTITVSKGNITSQAYEVTLTVTDDGFKNQDLYGFAFRNSNLQDFCIDDIAITLQSIDSKGQSTIHVPDVAVVPAVNGATISTTNQTIKMGFSFTAASEAIAIRGETIQKYGAVLVAGTQTLDTMKAEAAKFLDDVENNESESYVCTTRTSDTLPDIYSVTINNSNTDSDGTDNRGKRATAIAYVVTDQGVYYSDATINHSVMSVVKAIFNNTYLTDTDNVQDGALVKDSPLDQALKALGNSTYEELKAALTAAPTNAAQRDLLLKVHFALNKK